MGIKKSAVEEFIDKYSQIVDSSCEDADNYDAEIIKYLDSLEDSEKREAFQYVLRYSSVFSSNVVLYVLDSNVVNLDDEIPSCVTKTSFLDIVAIDATDGEVAKRIIKLNDGKEKRFVWNDLSTNLIRLNLLAGNVSDAISEFESEDYLFEDYADLFLLLFIGDTGVSLYKDDEYFNIVNFMEQFNIDSSCVHDFLLATCSSPKLKIMNVSCLDYIRASFTDDEYSKFLLNLKDRVSKNEIRLYKTTFSEGGVMAFSYDDSSFNDNFSQYVKKSD